MPGQRSTTCALPVPFTHHDLVPTLWYLPQQGRSVWVSRLRHELPTCTPSPLTPSSSGMRFGQPAKLYCCPTDSTTPRRPGCMWARLEKVRTPCAIAGSSVARYCTRFTHTLMVTKSRDTQTYPSSLMPIGLSSWCASAPSPYPPLSGFTSLCEKPCMLMLGWL